jgi:hypothetical protein
MSNQNLCLTSEMKIKCFYPTAYLVYCLFPIQYVCRLTDNDGAQFVLIGLSSSDIYEKLKFLLTYLFDKHKPPKCLANI